MLKRDKEQVVADLVERLRSSSTLILADYRGLSVSELDDVRTKILEHGARFTVVKNTLTKRAAEEAGLDTLTALGIAVELDRSLERGADLRGQRDLRQQGGSEAPWSAERDRKPLQPGQPVELKHLCDPPTSG